MSESENIFDGLYKFETFTYPEHFKHVDNIDDVYFVYHIDKFNRILKPIFHKPNICLEIGTHYGASAVWFLETICKSEGSHLYMMDVTPMEGYTLLEKNLAPYSNYTYIDGYSVESFKKFNHDGQIKEFLDFVYIDGSHYSRDVLADAINAFYCLKEEGIMCFDDYEPQTNEEESYAVKTAVDAFELCFKNQIEVIETSYQKWFLKRQNKSKFL